MTFSHWFEQLCAGDLNYYWNYYSKLINSLLINQPFVAAITLKKFMTDTRLIIISQKLRKVKTATMVYFCIPVEILKNEIYF